jgi:hypothetical protein
MMRRSQARKRERDRDRDRDRQRYKGKGGEREMQERDSGLLAPIMLVVCSSTSELSNYPSYAYLVIICPSLDVGYPSPLS